MPQESHKTQAVADALGIHPNSVRLWCEALKSFLSPGANPPEGEYRKFTNADLGVLRLAFQLRADKQSWQEIVATLDSMPPADRAPAVESVTTAPQNAPDAPSAVVPASAVVEAMRSEFAALQRFLDARPSVDALQSAHTKGFAQGVTAAVLVIMLVLLVLGILSSLGIAWIVRLF